MFFVPAAIGLVSSALSGGAALISGGAAVVSSSLAQAVTVATKAAAAAQSLGGVALKGATTAAKFAGQQAFSAGLQLDSAAIKVGERIAGDLGGKVVSHVADVGTRVANCAGDLAGDAVSKAAGGVMSPSNAKSLSSASEWAVKGSVKFKESDGTLRTVNEVERQLNDA